MRPSSVGDGGEPPVAARIGGSKRTPRAASASASINKTVGAPHRCVTRSRTSSSKMRAGSSERSITWRPAAAVTAQGKHQPLQWNSGSVHRNAELRSSRCTWISPSAFSVAPRCVYITPFGRPVVPDV